jgi:hypothetical protein
MRWANDTPIFPERGSKRMWALREATFGPLARILETRATPLGSMPECGPRCDIGGLLPDHGLGNYLPRLVIGGLFCSPPFKLENCQFGGCGVRGYFSFAGAKVQSYQALAGRLSFYYGDTPLEHTTIPRG